MTYDDDKIKQMRIAVNFHNVLSIRRLYDVTTYSSQKIQDMNSPRKYSDEK